MMVGVGVIFLWIILFLMILMNIVQLIDVFNRFLVDFMKNYNKRICGVCDMKELMILYFYFNFVWIVEYDEVNGKLFIVGYFGMFWYDF